MIIGSTLERGCPPEKVRFELGCTADPEVSEEFLEVAGLFLVDPDKLCRAIGDSAKCGIQKGYQKFDVNKIDNNAPSPIKAIAEWFVSKSVGFSKPMMAIQTRPMNAIAHSDFFDRMILSLTKAPYAGTLIIPGITKAGQIPTVNSINDFVEFDEENGLYVPSSSFPSGIRDKRVEQVSNGQMARFNSGVYHAEPEWQTDIEQVRVLFDAQRSDSSRHLVQ